MSEITSYPQGLEIYGYSKVLEEMVLSNKMLKIALDRACQLGIEEYYIGAGCIAQTVWNTLFGNPIDYGIKDIDFVYFDKNMDFVAENRMIAQIQKLYSDMKIEIDVKNQARVHIWYEEHFGYAIKPYKSLESAIDTWPTTATAIGIRKDQNGLKVYCPFGLTDLFEKIVRANKIQITQEIYEKKAASWLQKWPGLKIIPW